MKGFLPIWEGELKGPDGRLGRVRGREARVPGFLVLLTKHLSMDKKRKEIFFF